MRSGVKYYKVVFEGVHVCVSGDWPSLQICSISFSIPHSSRCGIFIDETVMLKENITDNTLHDNYVNITTTSMVSYLDVYDNRCCIYITKGVTGNTQCA
jgi:hypothetical protein